MSYTTLSKTDCPKLLIEVIEGKAQWIGGHTFMRYPSANWEADGYRTITWSQYADAINKVAVWLDEQLGKSHGNDTVAYLGPSDARYAILLPAVVKTNRKLLIPDGRVTKDGLRSLLEATRCTAWIHPEEDDNATRELNIELKTCALPALQWCLDSHGQEKYQYTKTFDEAKFEEIVIIHSSGTTGYPKPIYHTNGFYSSWACIHPLSRKHWPQGIASDAWSGKAILSSCPPQWLGGLAAYIFFPVFCDSSSIIPPADVTGMPPAVFNKLLRQNVVDGIICPPHTIHELYRDPTSLSLLKSFDFLLYAGAMLDRAIGDDLVQHTKIVCIIGSTETGPQINLNPLDQKLWYTHSYVPENGHRMVRVRGSGTAEDGSDDLYELVLERSSDGHPNIYQSAFWNPTFENNDVIETKELYAPVNDLNGQTRWAFSARKDDLTKLDWLAKFHAQDIETRIKQHPSVSNVFVGGEGRVTPYVIVELRESVLAESKEEDVLEELYRDVVVRSNEGAIREISIPRETVMAARREKPFKKTAKQTLMRKEVERDYMEEIEDAYRRLAETGNV